MSVHLPKTPETLGLIGEDELAKVKPQPGAGQRRPRRHRRRARAATSRSRRAASRPPASTCSPREPCTDSPLFEFENVVATPHLGASTDEAQEKAGIAVAKSVRLALSGELVPDAVNVQGGVIAEDVRPGIPLTEKLGRIFTALAGEVAQQLDVEVRGEITAVRRQGARARRPQGRVLRRRRGAGVLRQRAAARRRARRRRPPGHRRREPRPPQPDHAARHARRRVAGVGLRHPDRHRAAGAARRGRRLRRRHRADRAPGVLPLRRPARHGRHRRRHPRRGRGEHRRHAGRPRHQGRPRAGRALGRLGDPGRRARGDRPRRWTRDSVRAVDLTECQLSAWWR